MTWHQYNLGFTDASTRDRVASRELGPALAAAEDEGTLTLWWFLRKPHLTQAGEVPGWRLRVEATDPSPVEELLGKLTADGQITDYTCSVYEPETAVFGGLAAMDAAHHLFHADSRYLLTPPRADLGRRESAVLLCSALLRAARLDWHEQGDVWSKVAEQRQDLRTQDAVCAQTTTALRILLTADPRTLTEPGQLLEGRDGWLQAFEHAGQRLERLNRTGGLTRGLRSVLAAHVLFHLNRAAVTGPDQAILADAATTVILGSASIPVSGPAITPPSSNLARMTTLTSGKDAAQLRADLVNHLTGNRLLTDPAVRDAFAQVPREKFLPGVDPAEAYADSAVYTKTDAGGTQISAASQPSIVAMMLGQLGARPGERILEAGAGTGYNAALMGHIVGKDGEVITIDVDDDLVDGARAHLAAAGITNVTVLLGDGALGHPDGAPYDRVIATVGAWEVPAAWTAQLSPSGRLVVPLRLAGVSSRSIAFERDGDCWRSVSSELAIFMPLRGIGDDARRTVALTDEQDATLQVHADQHADPDLLAGILSADKDEEWTGVEFGTSESFEWLELWLSLTLPNPLMRMVVQPSAKEREGIVTAFGYGSTATTREGTLAYLTYRKVRDKVIEVGVAGHGPDRTGLATQVADQIRVWNDRHRTTVPVFTLPDGEAGGSDPQAARFVLDRPHQPIVVTW